MKLEQRLQKIRLILSDVDGVLTDGGITYDNQGVESKTFHVRDGLGIKLWMRAGRHFGLITARNSHIVQVRAAELEIPIVRQGFKYKWTAAAKVIEDLGLSAAEVCHIGDDLPDLSVMQRVGLAVAVADAAAEVREAAHYQTKLPGGRGAVRELVELVMKQQLIWDEMIAPYQSSWQPNGT